jgi:hypothetical protein
MKVGGSLTEYPTSLRTLCQKLSELSRVHRFLMVPGGGRFADVVREFDRIFDLSDTAAHKMAILSMDVYGLFLSDITPNSRICYTLSRAEEISAAGVLPIFLPSRLMFQKDPLEHSWNVTSDSIAAHIASLLHAKKLILLKDVDGIFTEDPKKCLNAEFLKEIKASKLLRWNKRTCVDKLLPQILLRARLECFVVNGRYPRRVEAVLEDEETTYTRITI